MKERTSLLTTTGRIEDLERARVDYGVEGNT